MDLYKPKNGVPAYLEIVDIAGLVRGASSGEGLGNAFLSHIAAVDGIFHVCRAFEDPDVIHVEDRVVGGAAAVEGARVTGTGTGGCWGRREVTEARIGMRLRVKALGARDSSCTGCCAQATTR